MFSLELKCQNARCTYKHPHIEQRHQKYLRKKIENFHPLKQMETSNLKHGHILLKGSFFNTHGNHLRYS